jgi:hypothetical protein
MKESNDIWELDSGKSSNKFVPVGSCVFSFGFLEDLMPHVVKFAEKTG